MSANIVDGISFAAKIKEDVLHRVSQVTEKLGRSPCLAVVLVGNDYASKLYTDLKHKACAEVGIASINNHLPSSISQKELLKVLEDFNLDPKVDGILVQLPLPNHIDKSVILSAINSKKDVDGLTPFSAGAFLNDVEWFVPSTALAVARLIGKSGIELNGKIGVVVGTSVEVGRPVALYMMKNNMTVLSCNSETQNLGYYTSKADVLVSSTGVAGIIKDNMVKPNAVVIDVGISRVGNKVVGDVDFEKVKEKAGWITPVPGGVGPVTVACLLENTVLAAERKAATLMC